MAKKEDANHLNIANSQLAFQNSEKEKRKVELITANKKLALQNSEKEKLAAELIIANRKLVFQNWEIVKRASELITANKELTYKNTEKNNRANDLFVEHKKLALKNEDIRTAELEIANKELAYQYSEKEKLLNELLLANKELANQNSENEMLANELLVANKELVFENEEKEKRAAELIIANKELAYQNSEKEKRAAELIIANEELSYQNSEKENRAAELVIANRELTFQNAEKHKRAEELLIANTELAYLNKEQQALFASIVNSSQDAIVSLTLEGIITSWNYGAEKIFGYKASEIIGESILTFIPQSFQKEEWERLKNIKEGKTVDHFDTERLRNDGTVFYASISISAIQNFKGEIVGVSKILRDITLQKQKEQHLKLLESVVTNTTDSVLITEAEPFDEPGPRIVFVNDAFTKMTGYLAKEVLGKTPRILQGPKSDRVEIKHLSEAIRKWESYETTLINYKKNGEEFWVNFSLSPVANEKGWYTHWIAIERDVTEQYKHLKTIEAQNTKLRDIAWTQSHIIRAPLARMLGLLNIMEMDAFKSDDLPQLMTHFKNSLHELDDVSMEVVQKTQSLDL